jgi:hypothetical protein
MPINMLKGIRNKTIKKYKKQEEDNKKAIV